MAARPATSAGPPPTSCGCSSPMASCTSAAGTTPSPTRRPRCGRWSVGCSSPPAHAAAAPMATRSATLPASDAARVCRQRPSGRRRRRSLRASRRRAVAPESSWALPGATALAPGTILPRPSRRSPRRRCASRPDGIRATIVLSAEESVEGRRRSRKPGFAVRRDPPQHRLAGPGSARRAGRLGWPWAPARQLQCRRRAAIAAWT